MEQGTLFVDDDFHVVTHKIYQTNNRQRTIPCRAIIYIIMKKIVERNCLLALVCVCVKEYKCAYERVDALKADTLSLHHWYVNTAFESENGRGMVG